MPLKIGIIGLPNVGKSTLFQAITKKQVEAQNYAFTTIQPNIGIVQVPDERLFELARVSSSIKIIPATATFVDIAGLVKDAHKGEGLGNKFLSNIREVNAIVHLMRTFTDADVTHVHGGINPKNDYEVIITELILADMETVLKRIEALEGKARTGDKGSQIEFLALQKVRTGLETGKRTRDIELTDDEQARINELQLLTSKPELKVYNVDERKNSRTPTDGIAISAKIESELAELSDEDARVFLQDLGWQEPGLNRLIRSAYSLLSLITYFTSGPKETRAWSVRHGSTAPEAAGEIHSDFEKQFIKAEVITWKDFVAHGELGAKEKGLMRLEGRDYIVEDGDVMYFHTNA
ncbi:MAG: redox-regulated ATPase YchF [Candidatus Kerfeldbacteria bacterium CG08_land_8_20_14_0_20_42_7]|uniref:Ribosome-binding ATPase YchF n=1 Tax=Candidatus Kerfeldbacteria bacterium CG08_land_8_20_14_0_20_42_7 TaxID=2014245 RepID=A0A2H0YVK0_9BACT|nr:MAG: redox-regulated ATPase YchF [Candidatus Kerfeldbacteria bacterium CG08_land_8_20_14_0_20_42_7]